MKSQVVAPVTSCVASVTVKKSGLGIWFIDENSMIIYCISLDCKNAASSLHLNLLFKINSHQCDLYDTVLWITLK